MELHAFLLRVIFLLTQERRAFDTLGQICDITNSLKVNLKYSAYTSMVWKLEASNAHT